MPPIIGPKKCSNPPRSDMKTSVPDWVQYVSPGSTWPTAGARRAPPTAAYAAEMTNAYHLYFLTLTPRYSAFSGLSLIAFKQRPKGEETIFHMTKVRIARITKA